MYYVVEVDSITDPLPAGTNEIGKVGQGTKAASSDAWPEYVVDSSGNPVGVVLDDTIYRFQTDSKAAKGVTSGDLVHLDALDTTSGRGRLKATLYTPENEAVAFGAVPSDPTNINNDFVKNGSNSSLLVNGSVTPVEFTFDADSAYDTSIQEIKFILVSNSITFGSNQFGAIAGPLTNGLLVQLTSNSNTGTVINITQNEFLDIFASPGGFNWIVSSKDLLSTNYVVGGGLKLYAGTGDNVKVTVRDNLESAGVFLRCFVKANLLPTS